MLQAGIGCLQRFLYFCVKLMESGFLDKSNFSLQQTKLLNLSLMPVIKRNL